MGVIFSCLIETLLSFQLTLICQIYRVIEVWKDSAVSCMIQIIEKNEGDLIAESLSLPKL